MSDRPTAASPRMELGTSGAPVRPGSWVKHRNVAPDWSAVPQQTVIELLAKGCREDPERPAIIIENGPTLTRREFLDRCQRFAGYLRDKVEPGDRVIVSEPTFMVYEILAKAHGGSVLLDQLVMLHEDHGREQGAGG